MENRGCIMPLEVISSGYAWRQLTDTLLIYKFQVRRSCKQSIKNNPGFEIFINMLFLLETAPKEVFFNERTTCRKREMKDLPDVAIFGLRS